MFAVSHQHTMSFIHIYSLLFSVAWGRQRGALISLMFFKYLPKLREDTEQECQPIIALYTETQFSDV